MATAATTAGHVKQSECCQVANKSLKFSVRINIDAGSAVDGMNTIVGIAHPSHPGFHICNTHTKNCILVNISQTNFLLNKMVYVFALPFAQYLCSKRKTE